MTSRRRFLQIGAAATTWSLAAGNAGAGGMSSSTTVAPEVLVYDRRYAAATAFARAGEAAGFRTLAIEGDMTGAWYDDIYHRWRRGPAAIAGLTGHGALFCFEQLARDQRMPVVFRAEHGPLTEGAMPHRVEGPEALLAAARRAIEGRAGLGRGMAGVVAACPRGRWPMARLELDGDASEAADAHGEPLYTWVIAPIAASR